MLLDRGHHLRGLVLVVDTLAALMSSAATARLRSLPEIAVLVCIRLPSVCAPEWRPSDAALAKRLRNELDLRLTSAAWTRAPRDRRFPETRPLADLIDSFAIDQNLPPGAIFMAGSRDDDLRAATAAGLALFKWTHSYFAPTAE